MKITAKKAVSLILVFIIITSNVYAFTFPTPDWGKLLKEKEAMVKTDSLELYLEAPVSTAPYYGARLEPNDGVYLGMIAETSEKFQPVSGYLTYVADMWQEDLYYPANQMIASDDVVTTVGWTIENIYNVDYNTVRRVLDTLSRYNKPMIIRFANEMNVSQLGDNPDKYIEVFKNVANMVHEYPNFAVVWSPNDLGALDRPFEYFYPGDEYVDWIGVSCYSIAFFQGNKNTSYKDSVYFMTGDYAWATNRIKPVIEFMEKNNINKPLMISEGGVPTNNKYGDDMRAWATPRLENMLWYLVMKYPQIKLINYFNTHRANEAERFDISDYDYAVDVFNRAKESGVYKQKLSEPAKFSFKQATLAEPVEAKGNIVPLYAFAYFAGIPNSTVNYHIDGNWYHATAQIPYKCNLDISTLADGAHTLTLSANGITKNYTFYKADNAVSFSGKIEPQIKVTLNGEYLNFTQPPVMYKDRVLVPMRVIFESLGATVDWVDATNTAIAKSETTEVSVAIDSNIININGVQKVLDIETKLIGGSTLVPVRAVSEAFGAGVSWSDKTSTVIISTEH